MGLLCPAGRSSTIPPATAPFAGHGTDLDRRGTRTNPGPIATLFGSTAAPMHLELWSGRRPESTLAGGYRAVRHSRPILGPPAPRLRSHPSTVLSHGARRNNGRRKSHPLSYDRRRRRGNGIRPRPDPLRGRRHSLGRGASHLRRGNRRPAVGFPGLRAVRWQLASVALGCQRIGAAPLLGPADKAAPPNPPRRKTVGRCLGSGTRRLAGSARHTRTTVRTLGQGAIRTGRTRWPSRIRSPGYKITRWPSCKPSTISASRSFLWPS